MTTTNKPSVVIDTNLFISGIIRGGTPYKLLKAWQQNKFSLITAQNLFDEIIEVFGRDEIYKKYNINQREIQQLLKGIKLNAVFITPFDVSDLPVQSRDPKDNKLLTCALGGKVDYLVTGDSDLLVLNGDPALGKLKIVSTKEFLNLISSS